MCRVEDVVAEDIGKVEGDSKPIVERWWQERHGRAITVPFVTSAFAWLKAPYWETLVASRLCT